MISKGQCFPKDLFEPEEGVEIAERTDGRTGGVENLAICITGLATTKGFSVLMANVIPDLQLQMNGQCFPLFLYETEEDA